MLFIMGLHVIWAAISGLIFKPKSEGLSDRPDDLQEAVAQLPERERYDANVLAYCSCKRHDHVLGVHQCLACGCKAQEDMSRYEVVTRTHRVKRAE